MCKSTLLHVFVCVSRLTHIGLINPAVGRIINVSSGVASQYLKNQDAATKTLFSNPDLTQEELDQAVKVRVEAGNVGIGGGYGIKSMHALSLCFSVCVCVCVCRVCVFP